MNPRKRYATLFTTIHTYVRARHRCFVAECFLSSSETEWVICIRPTEENTHTLVRGVHACKYFSLSLEEATEVCAVNGLGSSLWERIDHELRSIGDSVPGQTAKPSK